MGPTDDLQVHSARMLNDALKHLQSGLDLLDEACAPGHIGAHVDLALHQLAAVIGKKVAVPEYAES